ncbi:hypothetical protein CRG98_020624 [Punica granatum]|uniref:Reverse transcriptase domain-containing protein n=1 Tax=Punica granatum TaxID=22663 RepID=A0A2I0JRP9_PUNGR|nr:hypothetical protein CRG98_020624 [Punica granatum]
MPFGLTNAPTTFCTLMNEVLHPFLDRFVVVYLDDIVVYSQSLKDHVEHLRQVFEVLRENSLYVKREKCAFAKREVPFLGHIVGGGLLNHHRVAHGTLEEGSSLGVDGRMSRAAFDLLKRVVTKEPVLALPCYGKPFEVETDASDFAISGVLMQDGHLIAFESRKLSDIERQYTVQEKEMTAVVHCLRTWRHYLLGSKKGYSTTLKPAFSWSSLAKGSHDNSGARTTLTTPRVIEFTCRYMTTSGGRFYGSAMTQNRLVTRGFTAHWDSLKSEQKSLAGLLKPLPILECPWDSVLMDFIVNLPKSEGYQTLMVVVDRFSKYATFIPAKKDCPAEEATRLFMKHVVKYWGVLTTILSDRDPRFTGRF